MKNLKLLLSALFIIIIASSCTYAQKKASTNKTFPIQSFSSVKSEVIGNVIYTQSKNVSARAEGDKEMVDNLIITDRNGELKIYHDSKFSTKNKSKKNLTIYLSSPSINEIDVEGVGNWNMKGIVKADNLKIDFEGVGNFEALELQSHNIIASYEGVGNLILGGTTDFVEVKSEGVGNINTQKLIAKDATVSSSGIGSIKCYASNSVDINNNGVGSITYYGNPTVKNIKNSGVGGIKEVK